LLKKEAIDVISYEKVLPTLEEVFVQNVKEAQLA